MNSARLKKLKREIVAMRSRGGVSAVEIKGLLQALGRKDEGNGVWRSKFFSVPAITVHSHPGDMNKFTKNGILDDMDSDVVGWEMRLAEQEEDDSDDQD